MRFRSSDLSRLLLLLPLLPLLRLVCFTALLGGGDGGADGGSGVVGRVSIVGGFQDDCQNGRPLKYALSGRSHSRPANGFEGNEVNIVDMVG